MSVKQKLKRSIYSVVKHNRDGSYETRETRKQVLFQAADTLIEGNYKLHHISGLKQKHILHLNKEWQKQKLSAATVKNRMSYLRWLCEKIGKSSMVPSNDALGIAKRQYSHNRATAVDLKDIDLSKITKQNVLVQLHLQRHLGLRREEAIKFKPYLADQDKHVVLQPSWCKGGRGRIVPVLTPEARYWLDESKKLVKDPEHSLIPPDKTYIQQRYIYDKEIQQAGIKHAHGLRHAYAQERYKQLTGWDCPKQGGLTSKMLTAEQKQQDKLARFKISEELGHSREQITVTYLGR